MANDLDVALLGIGVKLDSASVEQLERAFSEIYDSISKQFDRIAEVTWDEFKEYSVATSKDVSKTWEGATKDMKLSLIHI